MDKVTNISGMGEVNDMLLNYGQRMREIWLKWWGDKCPSKNE